MLAISLLLPTMMRSLPSGCHVADLGPPASTRAPLAPRPAHWASRSLARLSRLAAWRYVRFSHATLIPAGSWIAGGPAQAAGQAVGPAQAPGVTGDTGVAGDAVRAAALPAAEPTVGPATGSAAPADAPSAGRATTGGGRALAVVRDRDADPGPAAPDAGADQQPAFPVDAVYTWIDDRDPQWRARYAEALRAHRGERRSADAVDPARFRNRDELRYSLRSLERYAPFVRNVYIVTAGQVPEWLDTSVPGLRVVSHEELLPADCLPTFNSHAIESALHRIDGLAEHYLYLNDDFFFGRECRPTTFFTADGRPRIFPDQGATVPDGPSSPADRPVDSASKNTREILAEEFDFPVKYKIQHVPYPQRRSVLAEMEDRFPRAFKQTARNPFRHHTDVNVPSCLSHYYELVTGGGETSPIEAAYVNISNPWTPLTLRRMRRRGDRDVFCLNDCPMSARRRALADDAVGGFLEAYFPGPSAFELDQ